MRELHLFGSRQTFIGPKTYQYRLNTRTVANVTGANKRKSGLEHLGFSFERGGVHTARTMMLVELRALLSYVDTADAAKSDYLEAIQTANCLAKRSGKTRALTFRHLADLYALDPGLLVFRALRFFWRRDVDGQRVWTCLRRWLLARGAPQTSHD